MRCENTVCKIKLQLMNVSLFWKNSVILTKCKQQQQQQQQQQQRQQQQINNKYYQ